MSKIIIQLQGGLVQDVFIKGRGIPTKAITVDEDVEGTDSEDITSINLKGKKTYEACLGTWDINKLPKDSDVDRIVKAYSKK
jgi:hypothetical protein